MVSALESQTQNFIFVETGFTSRTDFVVVRHSGTSSGLPKNNQFHLEGKADGQSYVTKYVYSAFAPISFD
jgi:hypothetical protein